MIKTTQYENREVAGRWHGEIIDVETEPNQYYEEGKQNSTEETLTIVFELSDIDNAEDTVVHKQRFVAPLLGGNGLLQQLVTVLGIDIKPGDSFNEDVLVGEKMDVEMTANTKGYNTVDYVEPFSGKKTKKKATKKVDADDEVDDDMPWEGEEDEA